MMMTSLEKAIAADAKYKKCAAIDREFIKYFENAAFNKLIK